MIISTPARTVLMFLYKQRRNGGNLYGNIAFHAGFATRDEVEQLCKILLENELAELRDDRVFITEAGKSWVEQYIEERDDRIREFVYDNYEFALLRFVYELDQPIAVDDFPEVLKEQAPKKTNGTGTFNLIHMLEIESRTYFQSQKNKYEITKEGRKRYEYLAKQLDIPLDGSRQSNSTQDVFTEKEKKEMNEKLDQVMEKIMTEFETIKMGQEIIWTDLKMELEELKQLYFLNKKNWRQLLTGKFTEMVAGGVVSETVSKKIVELINPVMQRLLK